MTTPFDVSQSATLEELQKIQSEWLDYARQNNIPEILWNILSQLGHSVPVYGHPSAIVWTADGGRVSIVGGEYQDRFLPGQNEYAVIRWLCVWVKGGGVSLVNTRSEIDKIISGSDPVAQWNWQIVGMRVDETSAVFVNGAWVNTVLPYNDEANKKLLSNDAALKEFERERLKAKLLIGRKV